MASDKTQARERAVLLLFEADSKDTTPSEVIEALAVEPERYALKLLEDYTQNHEEVNSLIEANTQRWSSDRLPGFDRAVLRMAITELVRSAQVPVGTIISEAVDLCERYSTPESPRFVNGVLGTVAHNVRGVALLKEPAIPSKDEGSINEENSD